MMLKVQARAVEVWGDEEKLEEARDQRTANKEKAKQKKFDKRVKGRDETEVSCHFFIHY